MAKIMGRPMLGGAVYILPNLLTTGNLFFGFLCIVKALQGQFGWAAAAVMLAALFDVLDGRVARLTRGTSEFGVQYDSICDVVSFGVAPAFLMYQFGLHNLGRVGWIVCFLFMACGALRLARFNVQSSIGKASGDFTGLPIPMAAIVMACFVSLQVDLEANPEAYSWLPAEWLAVLVTPRVRNGFMIVMGPVLAMAMVSNIIYRSHKVLKVRSVKPFKLLVLVVLFTGLLAYEPELVGFVLVTFYACSGPVEWMLGWKKAADDDDIFTPHHEDDSIMEPWSSQNDAHSDERPNERNDSNVTVRALRSTDKDREKNQ